MSIGLPRHLFNPATHKLGFFEGKVFRSESVDGVAMRVYSVAKTVADLFKMRNKVGVDVGMEALRDALRVR